jgi:hypothetical protein
MYEICALLWLLDEIVRHHSCLRLNFATWINFGSFMVILHGILVIILGASK